MPPRTADSAMGNVEITIGGMDDLGGIRLLVAAFRDHLHAETPTDSDLDAQLPDVLSDASIEFACAWSQGQPVGYTQTRFFASLWAPGTEALLEDLFVLAPFRGRAIGRLLLRHALRRARTRGARRLSLTTNELNTPAQGLYEAEGFRRESAAVWPNGREVRWTIALDGVVDGAVPGARRSGR
jgi:ribosomal protein S18 acetylase RimI-like enzyme